MNLNRSERNKIAVGMEGFLALSVQPERSELMAELGLEPALLERGQALIAEWHTRRRNLKAANKELELATQAKQTLRGTARLEMSSLINLLRRQFYNQERVLRMLGLSTKRKTQTVTPDESDTHDSSVPAQTTESPQSQEPQTERVAVGTPREEATQLQYWREVLEAVEQLPSHALSTVELFGYNTERLTEVRQAVEAFASGIPVREAALATRKERTRLFGLIERELYTWVLGVRRMVQPRLNLLRRNGQEKMLDLIAI